MDDKEQKVLDIYERLSSVIKDIGELGVFPPLVWVWTWGEWKKKRDSSHGTNIWSC